MDTDDCFQFTNKTQTAGTEIATLVSGGGTRRRRVTTVQYRCAGTSHVLSLLRPAAVTTASVAAVATDTEIVLAEISRMGADVDAGDYIVWKDAVGIWHHRKVSGISTNTVTVAALTSDIAAGTTIFLLGAVGTAHNRSLPCTTSSLNVFQDREAGIFQTGFKELVGSTVYERGGNGDPLMFVSSNAAAAGTLEVISGCASR